MMPIVSSLLALFEPDSHQREVALNRLELVFWVVLGTLIYMFGWDLIVVTLRLPVLEGSTVIKDLFVGFLALYIILFRLIFDRLPFEALRHSLVRRRLIRGVAKELSSVEGQATSVPSVAPQEPFDELVLRSALLAGRIYRRAGVYLLGGVLIALAGVMYFAYTVPEIAAGASALALLAVLGPRFGIVFFVEVIAFYFLRQYREAMDEFRYYEGIQRQREDNAAILRFLARNSTSPDISKQLERLSLTQGPTKLSPGESTELLESRKLTKDELALFQNMLAMIRPAK